MPPDNVSEFVELLARVFGVTVGAVTERLKKWFAIWIRLFGVTALAFIGFAVVRTAGALTGSESVVGIAGLMMAGTAIAAAVLLAPLITLWRVFPKDYQRATGGYVRATAMTLVWILGSTLGAAILAPVLKGSTRYTTIYVLSAIILGLLWMVKAEARFASAPAGSPAKQSNIVGEIIGGLVLLAMLAVAGSVVWYLVSAATASRSPQTSAKSDTELTANDRYVDSPIGSTTYVVKPCAKDPNDCWTSTVRRPVLASREFWEDNGDILDVWFFFENGSSVVIEKIKPTQNIWNKRICELTGSTDPCGKVTGFRFRNPHKDRDVVTVVTAK